MNRRGDHMKTSNDDSRGSTLKPKHERLALEALDSAIRDLERLRALVKPIYARDEVPQANYDRDKDVVHQTIRKIHHNTLAISYGASRTLAYASDLSALQPSTGIVREVTSSTCIGCGRLVSGTRADRIVRGLCSADLKAFKRSGESDIVRWIATRNREAEQE